MGETIRMRMNEKGFFKSVILLVILNIIVGLIAYLTSNNSEIEKFYRKFFPEKPYEVRKKSIYVPISGVPVESINVSDMVKLRQMLENGQYDQLNALLQEYQKIFEQNQLDEYKLFDAYRAFRITLSSYEGQLKEWIDSSPEKYQPYLALSQFYYAKGWESRGYKWAKETSEDQFKQMEYFFDQSEKNVKIALKIKPNLMVAYNTLVGIYNATGEKELENRITEEASSLFPHSFLIHAHISGTKQPRWGGSYEEMEKLADKAGKYAEKNPRLSNLYGLIYCDQAIVLEHNQRYQEALDLFDKALNYGNYWLYQHELSKIYYSMKLFDQALEAANKSIELHPVLHENHLMRSRVYCVKGDYDRSIRDLQTAEKITPGDLEIQEWKELASDHMLQSGHGLFKTDLPKAIEYYNLAAAYNEEDFRPYYWRGVALGRLNNLEFSLSDFQRTIKLNPHHFESYRMIDRILSRNQQWKKIIHYWNSFIELEPDHADAYFERSGSHYHNKDMERAMKDLKKACDLGNKEACQRYQTITQ